MGNEPVDIILKYFSDFTAEQLKQFKQLDVLYRDWNEKINLISRKDIGSLYEKHILHSLGIAAVFEFKAGTKILDIGTGGGFPGIPLAIFFPDVQFHLVDSIGKKIKAVQAISQDLGLMNVTSEQVRAEDLKKSRPDHAAGHLKYDFIVSRAVAPLKDLWKWSLPLLRYKGQGTSNQQQATSNESGLICLKGGDLSVELKEANLRHHIIEIHALFREEYFRDKYIIYVPRS
jgi:16S rRNA (guanine527-N7)-methyltransferase